MNVESGNFSKEKVKNFFDSCADRWDYQETASEEILHKILDNVSISSKSHVLDVACGTGVLTPYYIERNVKCVHGVDISKNMIQIAKKKFQQAYIHFFCCDIEVFVSDIEYDRIVIYNAFPHFQNSENLIKCLVEKLKPGGFITIAHGLSRDKLNVIHSKSANQISKPLPEIKELSKLLQKYVDIKIEISNDEMYQIVGKKSLI